MRIIQAVAHLARKMMMSATEGVYLKGEESSENRRRLLTHSLAANITANLIGGNFFTGLLIYMSVGDSFIGLMTMFTLAANALQIFSPIIMGRFKNRKRALIIARCVMHTINILFIAVIPLFSVERQIKLAFLGGAVLIVNLINAMNNPGFSSWHLQFLPQNVRAKYFSIFTMANGILVAVANLLGSRVLDTFRASGIEYWGFFSLRAAGFLIAAIDIFMLIRLKPPEKAGSERTLKIKELFTLPFKQKAYLRTAVLCAFLWSLIANIPGAFYTVYLLENVKVSYTFITLVSMMNVPILLFVTPLFTKLVRRVSWVKTLCAAMSAYSFHYILLALVTQQTLWLYPVSQLLALVLAVGINLAFTGIPYVNIPEENQMLYIGFYSTLANVGAFLGASFGRWLIGATEGVALRILGADMINKQFYLLLVFVLMLIAAGVIYFLQKGLKTEEQ